MDIPRQSHIAPIALLRQNGVPFRALVDVGCADGTFALECQELFGRDLAVLNVEAQSVYEPSLARIRAVTGAQYRITAVGAYDGQIRFAVSGDSPYWSKVSGAGQYTECRTLETLLAEAALPGPVLIKMDIEGGEFGALQGAVNILDDVAALILETDFYYGPRSRGNFLDVHAFLAARNFSLFDIVSLGYRADNVLFEIYTVFLNRRFEFRDRAAATGEPAPAEVLAALEQRRRGLLARNEEILGRWR